MKKSFFLLAIILLFTSCEIDKVEYVGVIYEKEIQETVINTETGLVDEKDFIVRTKYLGDIYVSENLYNMIELRERLMLNSDQFSTTDDNNYYLD
jgi:hypothetical protein